MENQGMRSTWCVGRFAFSLPAELAAAGRAQRIYRLDIHTEAIAAGAAAEQLWSARIARIAALRAPPGEQNPIVRQFALAPGIQAVWYFNSDRSSRFRVLEAARAFDDHVLVLARGGEVGKEPIVETLVRNVALGYVPGATSGFCVGAGSLPSLASRDEDTRATFVHSRTKAIEIRLSTATIGDTKSPSPMADIDQEARALAQAGAKLVVLKNAIRSAAGLDGEEGIVSLDSPGEGRSMRMTWFFPGVSGRSDQPEIRLRAVGPLDQRLVLDDAWNTLLASLRSTPPGPK
ncbi:MAG: hypothetical protein IT531_07380 [Burkholderiales bacterium]|nr:hypothetical protein [Burkholderiales bacterium]